MTGDVAVVELLRHPLVHVTLVILFVIVVLVELLMLPSESAEKFPAKTRLDALHRVFEELRRVSDRYVIVSLPNCWGCSRQQIQRGRGSISHYGLPAERPVDRHKWFINITQSREFFESKATAELKLLDLCIVEKPRNWLVRAIRKLIYRGDSYANRYAHTLFAVYEKSTGQNE